MSSDLEIHQSRLRIFDVEGEQMRFGRDEHGRPYVVAVDIARRLAYRDAANALRQVEDDEKGTQIVSTPGGPQQMWVVYKDGIWELIFRSSKPEAKAIKKRVKAILNEIGETGSYGQPKPPAVPDMSTAEGRLLILDMARQAELRAIDAEKRAKELEPDAARARRTMDADGLSLVGTVAKRFGVKEKALRQFLYGESILIQGGIRHNEPMAKFVQSGHFEVKTRPVDLDPDGPPTMKSTTYVTPKGEALIWKRLYEAGYVNSPEIPARQLELISV